MAFRPAPVQRRPFGKGVTRAAGARPPLAEPHQGRVVARHLGVQPLDPPAFADQAQAHLGFFAGDQVLAVAADARKRVGAQHPVAADGARGSDRGRPFGVDQAVVAAGIGVAFAPAAGDRRKARVGVQPRCRVFDPAFDDLAIAIDELDEVGPPRARFHQRGETGVAGAGGGEGARKVKLHDLGPKRARRLDAAVGRAGIHIDKPVHAAAKGVEAGQ